MVKSTANNRNSLMGMTLALFALNKQKEKKTEVYWVIEESDSLNDEARVKFYNDADELLHEEVIKGIHADIIDDTTILRLNQTKQAIEYNLN